MPTSPYCISRTFARRRRTAEVAVGAVAVGGDNPLRVQSMTTTPTLDVAATVAQCVALAGAGCEIVRVTAQNVRAAAALAEIRRGFSEAGFAAVPLVADIHFLPAAAMEAVEHVEKVRVNPGNYADRKKFKVKEYSDAQYAEEIDRLHEAFSPLVKRAKELGRALRIGTNHGSLSDRIMNRYGDSPHGMAESALEFVRIAESHGFRDIILSMKASNPKVMVEAYRLVTALMADEGMAYPLHLGVTEAGDGDEARIKSAIGIGGLLVDGLGDTIRVSLTEDPVYEVPVAFDLAEKAMRLWAAGEAGDAGGDEGSALPGPGLDPSGGDEGIDPYDFCRREVVPVDLGPGCTVASNQPPRVILALSPAENPVQAEAQVRLANARLSGASVEGVLWSEGEGEGEGESESERGSERERGSEDEKGSEIPPPPSPSLSLSPSPSLSPSLDVSFEVWPVALETVAPDEFGRTGPAGRRNLVLLACGGRGAAAAGALAAWGEAAEAVGVFLALDLLPGDLPDLAPTLRGLPASRVIVTCSRPAPGMHAVGTYRALAAGLRRGGVNPPIWIRNTAANAARPQDYYGSRLLEAATLTGALLCDGIGDLVSVETEADPARAAALAFNILQGARARTVKTEFVACPSCGRTLFDLQTTTQRIREHTGHLKGVTIAVMGCIVNGPGEMADADFGYVGGAPGKVNLYIGKSCVQHHIPQEEAIDRLVDLIKQEGKWVDRPAAPAATAS